MATRDEIQRNALRRQREQQEFDLEKLRRKQAHEREKQAYERETMLRSKMLERQNQEQQQNYEQNMVNAQHYEGLGEYEKAARYWERVPNEVKAQYCWSQAAKIRYEKGDVETAAFFYANAGENKLCRRCYAEIAEQVEKKSYADAVPYWEKAGQPDRAKACWGRVAEELEQSGKYREAVPYWEKAGQPDRAKACWGRVAEELEQSGKYREAVPYWEKAGQPEKVRACWGKIAEGLEQNGKYAEAVPCWEKAGERASCSIGIDFAPSRKKGRQTSLFTLCLDRDLVALDIFAYGGDARRRKVPYAGMSALLEDKELWADSDRYLRENVTPEAPSKQKAQTNAKPAQEISSHAGNEEAEAFYAGILETWTNLREADLDGVKRFVGSARQRYGSAVIASCMPASRSVGVNFDPSRKKGRQKSLFTLRLDKKVVTLNIFAYEGDARRRKVPYAGMAALLGDEALWADSDRYLAENVTPEASAQGQERAVAGPEQEVSAPAAQAAAVDTDAGGEAEAFYAGILKERRNLKEADLDGVKRFVDFVLQRYGSAVAAAYMPDRIRACWGRIAEGLEIGGKYEAAVPYWEKAGEPDKVRACWGRAAEGLEKGGKYEAAVPYWEKAGETDKAKACCGRAAEGLEQGGRYGQAVAYWEKAGEPDRAKACLCKSLEQGGRYLEAAACWEKIGNAGQARRSLLLMAKKLKDEAGEDEEKYVKASACCLMADESAAAESLLDQAVALRKKKTFLSFLVGRQTFKDMLAAEKRALEERIAAEKRNVRFI